MKKTTVLICDDNPAIHKSLIGYFEQENFEVTSVASGEDAISFIRDYSPDAVILDIMLPGISGLDVCQEIKRNADIPVILLSAKGEEIDRIVGLEIGADDYVTKPFSPREVVVRTKKLLKRRSGQDSKKVIILAELEVYPESYEVFVNKQRVRLTSREFEALLYLIQHVGRPVTREHILNAVWGSNYIGEPRIVDTLIKRIRQKLFADDTADLHFSISTIYGLGYKIEEL